MNKLEQIKFANNRLFYEIMIELGSLRASNLCASCGKKIDIKIYHIQLCQECRKTYLENYIK